MHELCGCEGTNSATSVKSDPGASEGVEGTRRRAVETAKGLDATGCLGFCQKDG